MTYLYVREASRWGQQRSRCVSFATPPEGLEQCPTAHRQVMIESTYHMKEMSDFHHTVLLGSKMARLAEHRSGACPAQLLYPLAMRSPAGPLACGAASSVLRARPRTILVAAKMLGDELPKLLSPEVSER